MYGFTGYGTNAYASERQSFIAPVVRFAMRVVEDGYGAALPVMARFKNLAVATAVTGISLMLRFRNLALSNPSNNQRTLEL